MKRLISNIASFFVLTFALVVPSLVYSQNCQLASDPVPKVWITGESTLHGWEVTTAAVKELPQQVEFTAVDGSNLTGFVFSVDVDDMDGGRGASMNKKIKGAFNSTANPIVKFEQVGSTTIKMSGSDGFTADVVGSLLMAGVAKEITLTVTGKITGNSVEFSGEKDLVMSEYGIEPPTAMFGQIVTDDNVVVHFTITYTQE